MLWRDHDNRFHRLYSQNSRTEFQFVMPPGNLDRQDYLSDPPPYQEDPWVLWDRESPHSFLRDPRGVSYVSREQDEGIRVGGAVELREGGRYLGEILSIRKDPNGVALVRTPYGEYEARILRSCVVYWV